MPIRRYDHVFGRRRLNLLRLLPESNASVYLIFVIHILASLLLTVGLATRVSAGIAFLTLTTIHHRNDAVFHSGDTLMRLMTFLLIFSRAGQAYSLDCYLASGGQSIAGTGELSSPWCQRLMQLQLAIVYVRAVYWKLRGKAWLDGTAAYYPLHVRSYTRCPLPKILQNRICLCIATWGTIVIEAALGLLIWFKEFRYPVLIGGVVLHLGLDCLLNIQLFGWIMMSCLILFVPSTDMEWFLDSVFRLTHID